METYNTSTKAQDSMQGNSDSEITRFQSIRNRNTQFLID